MRRARLLLIAAVLGAASAAVALERFGELSAMRLALMDEERRVARELDAIRMRLNALADAYALRGLEAVSAEERDELLRQADDGRLRLALLIRKHRSAESVERAAGAVDVLGTFARNAPRHAAATDVISVMQIDQFPKTMSSVIMKLETALAREAAAYNAAVERREAARRRRMALGVGAAALAAFAAFWVFLARRR